MLIYRGSTNERLSAEGVAYDSYYNETDRVTITFIFPIIQHDANDYAKIIANSVDIYA